MPLLPQGLRLRFKRDARDDHVEKDEDIYMDG